MNNRRTKIVCTIGPASRSPDAIEQLIEAGMNVARLNFSHGSHADHAQTAARVRAGSARLGRKVAILQDLSGPKLRIGTFADGKVELAAGNAFVLTSREVPGDVSTVSMNCPELIENVKKNDHIILADGQLEMVVNSTSRTDIVCEVLVAGELSSHKGISAPGVDIKQSVPTEKDIADLEFGLKHHVDWVAQSFVRSADEIRTLRSIIHNKGADVPIIAKIEKRQAVDDLDRILDQADAVMVARGDLAFEVGLKEIPAVQKEIIHRAGRAGKPEITATQMMESMITNPRPTRAEVTDIANAIFDGTDAIMLSGETAVGRYPVDACRTMAEIAAAAETHIDYVQQFRQRAIIPRPSIQHAIGHAACDTALMIDAAMIICCTRSGRTASIVANYRPHAPIAVASPDDQTLLRTMLLWGTMPVKTELADNTDRMIAQAKQAVLESGLAQPGDKVVIVAGNARDQSDTVNTIKADIL